MFKIHGFSLFELLIALAIIGILTMIAIPHYSEHLTHEHRIEAEITLEKLAASFEQYYVVNNTYKSATLQTLGLINPLDHYQIDITMATDSDFLLTATPLNEQAEKDVACATLTLNNKGEKGITGQGKMSDCW